MRGAILVSVLALTGCATAGSTPDVAAPIARAGTLPAQTLAPGECGLFGYSVGEPRFVFFATGSRAAYLGGDDAVLSLTPVGDFPAADYGPVSLALGRADDWVEGRRYPGARLTETLDEGFERVVPLVVVQTCQSR